MYIYLIVNSIFVFAFAESHIQDRPMSKILLVSIFFTAVTGTAIDNSANYVIDPETTLTTSLRGSSMSESVVMDNQGCGSRCSIDTLNGESEYDDYPVYFVNPSSPSLKFFNEVVDKICAFAGILRDSTAAIRSGVTYFDNVCSELNLVTIHGDEEIDQDDSGTVNQIVCQNVFFVSSLLPLLTKEIHLGDELPQFANRLIRWDDACNKNSLFSDSNDSLSDKGRHSNDSREKRLSSILDDPVRLNELFGTDEMDNSGDLMAASSETGEHLMVEANEPARERVSNDDMNVEEEKSGIVRHFPVANKVFQFVQSLLK